MWTVIGVGILVVAQAGALPASRAKEKKAAVMNATTETATGANAEAAGSVHPADTDASVTETPSPEPALLLTDTTLRFRNDVSDAFQLNDAHFTLDGRDLPGLLTNVPRGQEYVIFTGPLRPGRHIVASHLTYQGRARSIFTYMKGYTLTLDTMHELNVSDTGATSATIVGRPNKGLTVSFEHSLKVELDQQPTSPAPAAAAR